jgi:hypothetical protein
MMRVFSCAELSQNDHFEAAYSPCCCC